MDIKVITADVSCFCYMSFRKHSSAIFCITMEVLVATILSCNLLQQHLTGINKKSPAIAKGNVQQRCMFESPVKQNLKFTQPSNYVSFTVARGHQTIDG